MKRHSSLARILLTCVLGTGTIGAVFPASMVAAEIAPKDRAARLLDVYSRKFNERNYAEALAAADEVIRLLPGHSSGYVGRATALVKLQRFDEAEQSLIDAIQRGDQTWQCYYATSEVNLRKGAVAQATEDINNAINRNPAWADLYFTRARCYMAGRREAAAIEDLDSLIKSPAEPKVDFYLLRAEAYVRQGRYKEALADYNQGLKLNPKNGRALLDRCMVHVHLEDLKSAEADTERAAQAGCDRETLVSVRSYLKVLQGQYEEAQAELQEALNLNPDRAMTVFTASRFLAFHSDPRKRDLKMAVLLAKKAAEVTQHDDWRALQSLVEIAEAAGDLSRATSAQRFLVICCHNHKLSAEVTAKAEAKLKELEQRSKAGGR